MTEVIELFGSPGSGKSTMAASIFCQLKQRHINAEMVREYVKDWMWIDRQVDTFDQFYILGKQLQKESITYGKVDVLINDSPLWLVAFYEEYRLKIHNGPCTLAMHALQPMLDKKTKRTRLFITKQAFPYNDNGRDHSEKESLEIEKLLYQFLERNSVKVTVVSPTDDKKIVEYL